MNKSISILGAGSWGTALAVQLGKKGLDVLLYGRDLEKVEKIRESRENKKYLPGVILPDNVQITADFAEAAKRDILVLTVPSQQIRGVVRNVVKVDGSAKIFVNTAKGLEKETSLRLSEVIRQEMSKDSEICVLSGPSHAEEVGRFLPTAIVAAAFNSEIAEEIQDVFMTDSLRVYTNSDIIGVEIGGAAKNVVALAAGITTGLEFGDNSLAAIMTRGLHEIVRLGVALGAEPDTFSGLTGLGDLIVTCNSRHSRNRTCGLRLGRGEKLEDILKDIGMVVEGVDTAVALRKLARSLNVEMPITEEICKVLLENKSPRESVISLMSREKKEESQL